MPITLIMSSWLHINNRRTSKCIFAKLYIKECKNLSLIEKFQTLIKILKNLTQNFPWPRHEGIWRE